MMNKMMNSVNYSFKYKSIYFIYKPTSVEFSVDYSLQSIHITKWKLLLLESWGRQGFIFKLPTSYVRLYFPSEWTMRYNCTLLYLPPQSVRLLFSPYTFTYRLSVWRWKYENKMYSLQSHVQTKSVSLNSTFPGGKS